MAPGHDQRARVDALGRSRRAGQQFVDHRATDAFNDVDRPDRAVPETREWKLRSSCRRIPFRSCKRRSESPGFQPVPRFGEASGRRSLSAQAKRARRRVATMNLKFRSEFLVSTGEVKVNSSRRSFLGTSLGASGTGFGALRIRLACPGAWRARSRAAIRPQVDLCKPREDGDEDHARRLRLHDHFRSKRDRARGRHRHQLLRYRPRLPGRQQRAHGGRRA